MNKSKRSLRSTLAELAAAFADAVIATARESILELAPAALVAFGAPIASGAPTSSARPRVEPRRQRARVASVVSLERAPSPTKRTRPARVASEPPAPHHESVITDPQALLTALETAGPSSGAPSGWETASEEPPPRKGREEREERKERKEPEILRPISAVAPSAFSAFAPREGEVIVRRSAGGVVLRRRRA